MQPIQIHRKAEALARFGAFISMADDPGTGTLVAVKDNIDVQGMVTTAGGKHLPPDPAQTDAPIVSAIKQSGCSVIGKANMHEYAFGVTNHNVHHGIARNPMDETRVPGGSSGGSAVAVALRLCDWAIGTDTGGSTRIPAGLCGIVGMKPTTGSLSIEGIFPLAQSLDVPGPMALDVVTVASALSSMTGGIEFATVPPPSWEPSLAVPQGGRTNSTKRHQPPGKASQEACRASTFRPGKRLRMSFSPSCSPKRPRTTSSGCETGRRLQRWRPQHA